MAALNNLYKKGTQNALQFTLNGSITSSSTTITLSSVTGLTNAQGAVVIDRTDANGTSTPTTREYIAFDSVSGNNLVLNDTTRRGLAGSTAQSHSSGAIVEEVFGINEWNGFITSYTAQHVDSGAHVSATNTGGLTTDTLGASSTASISGLLNLTSLVAGSQASISQGAFVNRLLVPIGVSGASIAGEIAVDNARRNLVVGDGTLSSAFKLGPWTAYSSASISSSGAAGGAGMLASYTGRYAIFGKLVVGEALVSLASIGALSGNLRLAFPVSVASISAAKIVGTGREDTATGKMLQVVTQSTGEIGVVNYDNTAPVANQTSFKLNFFYESL